MKKHSFFADIDFENLEKQAVPDIDFAYMC